MSLSRSNFIREYNLAISLDNYLKPTKTEKWLFPIFIPINEDDIKKSCVINHIDYIVIILTYIFQIYSPANMNSSHIEFHSHRYIQMHMLRK